jgi:hypothetical protein
MTSGRTSRSGRIRWPLALLVLGAPPVQGADAPPAVVRYDGGRVTVRATGANRPDVIATLGREADLVIAGEVLDPRPVDKRFADLALPAALDRLLGRQNFVLVYDDAGRPRRVELLALPAPPAAGSPPPTGVRRPPARRPRPPRVQPPSPAPAGGGRLGWPRVQLLPRR